MHKLLLDDLFILKFDGAFNDFESFDDFIHDTVAWRDRHMNDDI